MNRTTPILEIDPAGGPAGTPTTAPAPADNALTLVHLLSNRITRAFSHEIESRFGVSLAEWRVIMTLARYPDIAAVDIAARWSMDKMTVSRAIRRLDEAGKLRCRPHPDDHRSFTVSLTADGEALMSACCLSPTRATARSSRAFLHRRPRYCARHDGEADQPRRHAGLR